MVLPWSLGLSRGPLSVCVPLSVHLALGQVLCLEFFPALLSVKDTC